MQSEIAADTTPEVLSLEESVLPIVLESQRAFEVDLKELLKRHRGKWVAYHGAKQIGIGPTETGLYAQCFLNGLKRDEIVVRSIEPLCEGL